VKRLRLRFQSDLSTVLHVEGTSTALWESDFLTVALSPKAQSNPKSSLVWNSFEFCIAVSSDRQSISAKEHENSFPYVNFAKTNTHWQSNHRSNLESFSTGVKAPSQHESLEHHGCRQQPCANLH
jgi:hypothetical protein